MLLNKINLYIDSFSRLDFKQRFFWILNRYIRVHLPRVKPNDLTDEFYQNYTDTKKRLDYLLIEHASGQDIWKLGVNEKTSESDYKNNVVRLIKSNKSVKDFEWGSLTSDIEIVNNIQRFFLFPELLEEHSASTSRKVELILQWIDSNPPFDESSWNSFNCSVRLLNWIKIIHSIPETELSNNRDYYRIQNSIYKQSQHISKNIEHHISGNHIFIQYFSLWLVSLVFDKWEESAAWVNKAQSQLVKEFESQFLESGLHYELSFHYHIQITLFGVIWVYICSREGTGLSNRLQNQLKKTIDVANQFILPNGSFPMIGDNCFPFLHDGLKPDIQNLNAISQQLLSIKKTTRKALLELDNNYLICNLENSHLIVDVGSIGLHKNCGHGHSDMLSFIYSVNGQTLFVDPGTRRYSNDAADLDLKRSFNHNTLTVNKKDQASLWGFFRWAYLPKQPKYFISRNEDTFIIQGDYTTHKKLGGYYHSREFIFGENNLKIQDRLKGASSKLSINFILNHDIQIFEISPEEVLLTNTHNIWRVSIISNYEVAIEIENILIYKSYNESTESKRIALNFLKKEEDFSSEILIEEIKNEPNQ